LFTSAYSTKNSANTVLPIHIDYVKLLLALYQTVSELEYITKFYNV